MMGPVSLTLRRSAKWCDAKECRRALWDGHLPAVQNEFVVGGSLGRKEIHPPFPGVACRDVETPDGPPSVGGLQDVGSVFHRAWAFPTPSPESGRRAFKTIRRPERSDRRYAAILARKVGRFPGSSEESPFPRIGAHGRT